jgi:hypothetical protein
VSAVTTELSVRWINYVNGVYLVQVSLLLIGQQGLGDFFRYWPLLPIGPRIVQIYANPGGKHQLLLVQYKQQANLLFAMNNYTPFLISWIDKNKQLTLLSQRKFALTTRYSLSAL